MIRPVRISMVLAFALSAPLLYGQSAPQPVAKPVTPPAAAPVAPVAVKMKLNTDFNTATPANQAQFQTQFKNDISNAAKITPTRIKVDNVTGG